MRFIVASRRSNAALPSSDEATPAAANNAVAPATADRTRAHLRISTHPVGADASAPFFRPDFRAGPFIPGGRRLTTELGNKSRNAAVWIGATHHAIQENKMADRDDKDLLGVGKMNRRGLLKCMAWTGTGVVWTLTGGVPHTLGFVGWAGAAQGAPG